MDLPKSIVKEFAKQAVEKKPTVDKPTQLVGTVHVEDGQTFVYLDGSNGSKTPVSETVAYQSGDRVLVSIQNRKATIIGNYTGPSINQALDNVIVEYALSSNSVSFIAWPGEKGEWNTIAPEKEDGSYMWQRTTKISTNPLINPEISLTCIQGSDGENGYTPYIGSNGNWWINGVDTGYSAEGDDGHSPYVNTTTNTWWEWDAGIGGYHDTGIVPQGPGVFKSIVFKRFSSEPSTPTGGSYLSPVPSGWSDGIPSGTEQIWMSTRVFTSNGESPQTSKWTTPQMASDTPDIDFEYSWIVTNPGNPTDNPDNWSNAATENSIWMAVRKKSIGTWSSWEISKIKGEKGADGEMSAEQLAQLNQASEDASQAKSDVANLEIGGRNLLTNPVYFRADGAYSNGITFNRTSNPSAWKIKGTATSEVNVSLIGFTNTSTPTDSTILLKEGQTYTESVKVEGSWSDSARIVVGISNSSGSWLSQVSLYPNTAKSHTFTATAEQYALRYWTVLIPSGESVDCTVYCKFEIGDKATDWIPAPDDVDAGINNAAKTATNYIHSDSTNGLVVNNNQTVGVGYDVQLKANGSDTGMNIRQDGNILASFLQNSVSLGKNSINSKVGMCGDKGGVSASFGYYVDSVTSNNAEMGSTLSFDFNETTFKNKVGQTTGFYEFTYTSADGWRLFDPVNDTSYAVTLSQYGITMKTPTSSIKDHAGITINYVLDGSVKFYNADISNPVRKLELEMAENPSSSESDFANITIERQSGTYANGDGKEHSIITMMTLHEFANVATLQLFDDDISLNATHLYLTSSYGDGAIQLDGDTNINGNLVVQGDNLVSKIQAMFCTSYDETLTVTAGTFTNSGCGAALIGNNLYLYLNAKAKAAISAGNIANQTMLTIKFTDNRISHLYSASGSGGASGPNSQMQFSATSSGGQHTITVSLAAIAQNIAKGGVINAHVSMPCVLNWDAF